VSLEPGKQVGPNLRLVRLIGRGAMGTVWVADHASLQAQVAVKFLTPAMLEDPVSVARFQQEAKAAAQIRSPHVVQVFDHGCTSDGENFIVMELLDGHSLEHRCKQQGALSLKELGSVIAQACKGLAKAHERGVIHRDIKPANLFLIEEGGGCFFVKVLDFGVAKFSGEEAINMTAEGNMVGTPAYMSPQQLFHGKEVSVQSDLWSLAVVAYYAVTGVRPFEGKTLGELCVAIKRGDFIPPGQLRSDLSPEMDAWFARGLHKDPRQRHASAKQMAEELERAVGIPTIMESTPSLVAAAPALTTFPGTSIRVDSANQLVIRSRRRLVVAALGGVLCLALVGGGIFVVGQSSGADKADAAPAAAAGDGAGSERASAAETGAGVGPETTPSAAPRSAGANEEAGGASAEPSASTGPEGAASNATPTLSAKPPAGVRPPGGGSWAPRPTGDERSDKAARELGI